ncbi:MAG TPA: serine acetyltransferase [Salinimicrobium sp.]|nr:serine acetyltransferase [Salinimicrobium sp.]
MKNLKHDIFRYCGVDSSKAYFSAVLFRAGARFMFLYRMCNKFSKYNPIGIFFRLWFKAISVRYVVEIPHATKIGKGLFMTHFQGIIFNQSAIIGENCNISQGVTIGRESRGKRKGSPTLGNRVMVGANSVVVGNIKIGDNVLIGPCTFVNFDVPSNSVVLGSPGKIISSEKGSEGYLKNILKPEN